MMTPDEGAQLKAEIAEMRSLMTTQTKQLADLRSDMAELRKFLNVSPEDGPDSPASLSIRCSGLILTHPEKADGLQAVFVASETGPSLTLYGDDRKARFILDTEDNNASCQLFGRDLKKAVELWAEDATGLGFVSVYAADKPRAIMKASPEAGVVSVVQDEGKPVAILYGTPKGGDLLLTTAEQKMAVKLSGQGEHGGIVSVNRADGSQTVVLAAAEDGGAVLLKSTSQAMVALMTTAQCSALTLHNEAGEKNVGLMAHQNSGHLGLSCGKVNMDLEAKSEGAMQTLTDSAGRQRFMLCDHGKGPILSLTGKEETERIMLMATDTPSLMVHGSAQTHALLNVKANAAEFALVNMVEKQGVVLSCNEKNSSIHLQRVEENQAAVTICSQPDGGLVMVHGTDGARRAALSATQNGGQLALFNDLGVARALMGSADDGGTLLLRWGGTEGVLAQASHTGGKILINNAAGQPIIGLPPNESDEQNDDGP